MTIPAVQAIAATPDPRTARSSRTQASEPRSAAPAPYVNPTLRLDADAGLVVMEFRHNDGSVTTIPNERQLAAYRAHQEASADLASARNAIETSTPSPTVDGFAEPQLAFDGPNTSATGMPAAGAKPSLPSAEPAGPAPTGLMAPGSMPTGPEPTGPVTSRTAGSRPPSNDGSAAGPARA